MKALLSGKTSRRASDHTALVRGLDTHTVGYRYDALGRRSDLVYPDKTKVSYDYDARNRLTTVDTNAPAPQGPRQTPLASYGYDALGRIDKLTRDNGVITAYTYDMAGQLTDITHKNGGTVLARSAYTLDVLGRRTSQTREDGIAETYGYDATSQLTSADYGAQSPLAKTAAPVTRETFAYDALGNRTQVARIIPNAPSKSATYTANSLNQYTRITGSGPATSTFQPSTPQYDANGNLINDGKQSYRYDAQNRLVSVETLSVGGTLRPDSVKAEFAYDARNRAILRKYYSLSAGSQWVLNSGYSLALTYDTAWNVLAERTPNGTQIGEYIHGQRIDGILSASLKAYNLPLTTYYPLADGLGSVVALTNIKGKIAERYRYSAYGRPAALPDSYQPTGPSDSTYRFLFTGREWLGRVGLNEHRNRYYSEGSGRWLSGDPIGFNSGSDNLYSYGSNSPQNFTDPLGLMTTDEWVVFWQTLLGVPMGPVSGLGKTLAELAADPCLNVGLHLAYYQTQKTNCYTKACNSDAYSECDRQFDPKISTLRNVFQANCN